MTPKLFRRHRDEVKETSASHYGRLAGIFTLHRDKEMEQEGGGRVYTEYPPIALPAPGKKKEEERAIVRYVLQKEPNSTEKRITPISHIKIQSPILRELVGPILKTHEIEFDDQGAFIFSPFEALVFARHEINDVYLRAEDNSEEKSHLNDLLNEIIGDDLGPLIDEIETMEAENRINWQRLWALFPPEQIVIQKEAQGHEQAYRVVATDYVNTQDTGSPLFFDITCRYVHFDGFRFGYHERNITIPHFKGFKAITDLDIYPLRLSKQPEYIREKFIRRGTKVLDYQDICHVHYGSSRMDSNRPNYNEAIEALGGGHAHGRAIIDFYTGAKQNDSWRQIVKPFIEEEEKEASPDPSSSGKGKALENGAARVKTVGLFDSPARRPGADAQERNKQEVLGNQEHLLLMSPLLHGFSLASKQWVKLNVDFISPVTFIERAFDHLVFPEKTKELVCALVDSHKFQDHENPDFYLFSVDDDVIPNKGKGLLVLLSGEPGTGKTLMVEAKNFTRELTFTVAEKTHRPLYYVDAKDLGTDYTHISSRLKIITENAYEWNAIVLIDEADVYLQERAKGMAERDEKVTVFLRHLEYFRGIMFMTTNLFNTLDKAVESRVHVHLQFSKLNPESRYQIWSNFLHRQSERSQNHSPEASQSNGVTTIKEDQIRLLSEWDINGRQIKNVLRMTKAYCEQTTQPLNYTNLAAMISITCPRAVKDLLEEKRETKRTYDTDLGELVSF